MVPKTLPLGTWAPGCRVPGGLKFFRVLLGPSGTKNFFFKKIFFAPIFIFYGPKGSGGLKTPKLTSQTPQTDPFWAILWAIWANWGLKNHVFFKKNFCSKSHFLGSQRVWRPQKPKIDLPDPPNGPTLGHFGTPASSLISHKELSPIQTLVN